MCNHSLLRERKVYQELFIVSIIILIAEIAGGYYSGSLSLLSDAAHVAVDMSNIVVAIFVVRLVMSNGSENKYRRRGAFISFGLLMIGSLLVSCEAIERFISPQRIVTWLMFGVAIFGLLGNFYMAYRLHRIPGKKRNITHMFFNMHVIADTLLSVVVVISGAVIMATGINLIDPVLSLLIARYLFPMALWLLYAAVFDEKHSHSHGCGHGCDHNHHHDDKHEHHPHSKKGNNPADFVCKGPSL